MGLLDFFRTLLSRLGRSRAAASARPERAKVRLRPDPKAAGAAGARPRAKAAPAPDAPESPPRKKKKKAPQPDPALAPADPAAAARAAAAAAHGVAAGDEAPPPRKKKKKKKPVPEAGPAPQELEVTLAKGDKPARRAPAPELPDDAETPKGFGISFNLDDTEAVNRKERRKCFRVGFPGLVANVAELGKKLKVRDVSVGGVALVCQARVKPGTRLTISLGLPPQTLFVSKVPATVIRCENGVLGLRFQDPDRHQEDGLHKVVLEAQKRAAELRRSKRTLPDEILNIKL